MSLLVLVNVFLTGAKVNFLETAQPLPPICLSHGESTFFTRSGWLSGLGFASAAIQLSPDYTVPNTGYVGSH